MGYLRGQPVPFHGAGALLSDIPAAAIDALAGLAGPDAFEFLGIPIPPTLK